MATAPVIKPKKMNFAYAIANITLFGILSMLFIHILQLLFRQCKSLNIGLFLGTSIHETSQVAAAGLIYDQQFNSPETLECSNSYKTYKKYFFSDYDTFICIFVQ